MILKGYLYSILYAALCLGIGFGLYKLRCPKTVTRKIVHILVGIEWIILYHFFGGGIHFLAVCLLFLAVLFLAHRKNLLPMIESDSDNSPGTVYYAVAMSIMAFVTLLLPDMIIPFGIGVFCTSFGDGFAGLMGQLLNTPSNSKIYGNKTIYGTMFNLIVCSIVVGLINAEFGLGLLPWYISVVALFATELELFTGRGLDNITVTLGASFLTYFLIHYNGAENYILPILATPLMIAFAHKKQALTVGGILSALAVDLVISVSLGNLGFACLLIFFVGGIVTDKIKNHHKNKGRSKKSKTECRNHRQVLANSTASVLCAILFYITKEKLFLTAFLASLAEALADTSASGIGALSNKVYDVFRFRKCAPGLSGGMSVLGTLASAVGAAVIPLVALCLGAITSIHAIIIVASAFAGAMFDSLLGSLLQIKFKCGICDAIVETDKHCGEPTVRHSGFSFVTNDTVNLLAGLFSALVTAGVFVLTA